MEYKFEPINIQKAKNYGIVNIGFTFSIYNSCRSSYGMFIGLDFVFKRIGLRINLKPIGEFTNGI